MKVRIIKGLLRLEPESREEEKLLVLLDGAKAEMPDFEAGSCLYLKFPNLGLKK